MKILYYYIVRSILFGILLSAAVMLLIAFFILCVNEMDDMGQGYYGFLQAFFYVALQLPLQFYVFLPMISLIGSLSALGNLSGQSELTIMRASGVSIKQIGVCVAMSAGVVILFAMLIGEVFVPHLTQYAQNFKTKATSAGHVLRSGQGTWIRSQDSFIYVDSVLSKNELQGISQYQFDDKSHLTQSLYAKSAKKNNDTWALNQVAETKFQKDHTKREIKETDKWDTKIKPKFLVAGNLSPEEMSLPQLQSFIHSRKKNFLTTANYELNFWTRISKPFTILVMLMLSLPFVFGSLRSSSLGLRILLGIFTGFFFYILNNFVGPFSLVFQFSPIAAALLPTTLFGLIALLLLRRIY